MFSQYDMQCCTIVSLLLTETQYMYMSAYMYSVRLTDHTKSEYDSVSNISDQVCVRVPINVYMYVNHVEKQIITNTF